MSRAYRIRLRESLTRHVQLEDGVSAHLEVLPILNKERMAELLANELGQRGFEREGRTAKRELPNGVTVTVNLETGEVSARVDKASEVNVSLSGSRSYTENTTEAKQLAEADLRKELSSRLEAAADRDAEALRRKLTAHLENSLQEARAELDAVVNRVTVGALKIRAGELGTIEEVTEDAATGSLTIKVRV